MADTSKQALERIADKAQFAAMPEVMARLIKMFDDPEITASQVAETLGKDAGLVTRVLRVANSAYYGGTGTVATVQQAIVKLGFRTTKAVVLSTALYATVNRSVTKRIDLRPFWQHGLEVGVVAMRIAEEVCPRFADEVFVAGLLHDIGRVALALAFPEEFRTMLEAPPGTWTNARELELFGVDHCEAGAFISRSWQLPALLTEAVASHHNLPEALPSDEAARVPLCIGLANSMASVSWAGPAALRAECRAYRERTGALAGLDADRLQVIEAHAGPQIEAWAQLLEMELCSSTELLAQVNEKLFALYQTADRLQRENEQLQERLLAEESERAALEALKVICATFSHHINNATTTILGRAQLVNIAMSNTGGDERSEKIAQSMTVIENAVDTITGVLNELKCLARFETTSYHGRAKIIKLKRNVAAGVD